MVWQVSKFPPQEASFREDGDVLEPSLEEGMKLGMDGLANEAR